MPDQPTDKVILKLDDDKLKELFSAGWLQPGDEVRFSAKLTVDEINDDVAVLSIVDDVEVKPGKAEGEEAGEPAELGPEEETPAGESAAMVMMAGKKDEVLK